MPEDRTIGLKIILRGNIIEKYKITFRSRPSFSRGNRISNKSFQHSIHTNGN